MEKNTNVQGRVHIHACKDVVRIALLLMCRRPSFSVNCSRTFGAKSKQQFVHARVFGNRTRRQIVETASSIVIRHACGRAATYTFIRVFMYMYNSVLICGSHIHNVARNK